MHPDDHKPFETFSEFLPYFTGEYGVCKYVLYTQYIKKIHTFLLITRAILKMYISNLQET